MLSLMVVDVFEFFWVNDEDDGVDEYDIEVDEEEWGRRWRKGELKFLFNPMVLL